MMIRLELDSPAEAELKRAIEIDPKVPQAHALLGQMALFRGRLDEAVALTEREIALNPANALAFSQLGDARVRQGKWDEAIAALQKSLWLNPFYSAPYILLGRAYMQKGQPATAEGMLTRAIEYDPNNRSAHYLLGQLLQRMGRTEEAKREFGIAERLQGQPGGERSRPPLLPVCMLSLLGAIWAASWLGPAQTAPAPWRAAFTDVARQAGLVEPVVYGGIDRKRFIIETNGAGVALVDYDRDGWLDALVLSGTRLQDGTRSETAWPPGAAPTNRLYRNRHDGTFEDVTDAAGLRRTGWASSVCAGDFDNDGWTDLFITYYGRNVLYRNRGGRFEDVTAQAGLPTTGVRWGSGCTFVDYDRDGRLDLFVANYLRFDLATAPEPGAGPNCLWKGVPVNCGPKGLPTDTNLLYRNRGDGTFVDVSDASGVSKVTGRYSMTAVTTDLDGDGWPDIYVASDSTAAILYRNNHDGTLSDVAVESGAAYSENGNAQAGMGVAVGDYDGDGRLDLFKTHFADDMPSLYRNLGKGLFDDVASAAGLGVENRYVEWGAGMPDLDNDGRPDLFYVTGNVYPEIESAAAAVPAPEPARRLQEHRRRASSR